MKKLLLLTILAAAAACFGAANDTLISFSTPGPDKYADGTTVKDGEVYALIWTKTGCTFAGLDAAGAPLDANSAVILFAPLAKDGRCPTVVFELDAAFAAQYAGGAFDVYLLDTRLANGAVGGVNAKGLPLAVNGYGSTGAATAAGSIASAGGAAISVAAKTEPPTDAPKPQITALKLIGDKVYLTVKNTLPCLQYAAQPLETLGSAGASTAPVQGAASPDAEITIVAPATADAGFFQVQRN